MGFAVFAAALAAAVVAAVEMQDPEPTSVVLLVLAVGGALALGAGLLNAWRVPLLSIRADRLVVPTFFGRREIALRPGHRVGELLATPAHAGNRPGELEANKFVHFFTLDGAGRVVELAAVHRASPMVEQIRRAFAQLAGVQVEPLSRDPAVRRPWPAVGHWRDGAA